MLEGRGEKFERKNDRIAKQVALFFFRTFFLLPCWVVICKNPNSTINSNQTPTHHQPPTHQELNVRPSTWDNARSKYKVEAWSRCKIKVRSRQGQSKVEGDLWWNSTVFVGDKTSFFDQIPISLTRKISGPKNILVQIFFTYNFLAPRNSMHKRTIKSFLFLTK